MTHLIIIIYDVEAQTLEFLECKLNKIMSSSVSLSRVLLTIQPMIAMKIEN